MDTATRTTRRPAHLHPAAASNPTAHKLVLQITETVLRVNTQGRWHGFFHFSGHVELLDLYFRPAGTDYQQPEQAPTGSRNVYTTPEMYDSEADMLRALRELHAFAKEHLTSPKPGKEAA